MLELSAHLPEVELAEGEVLLTEGTPNTSIWVLISGELDVRKSDVTVNAIAQPGALIGEMSILLGVAPTATVVAATPTRLRHALDGEALLSSDPAISKFVAVGLARRLDVVTTYLADLKRQYTDAPGLAMVSEVLGKLTAQTGPQVRPGSARDPDPLY
jgi:CRP/FNR family transcriptional regulator, cyclic AMP receptor protein